MCTFFFFNDTATTEIYTLSLHDALPIYCFRLNQRVGSGARRRWNGAGHCEGSDRRRHAVSRGQDQDRKSTRLNSSHLGISYAVFCLQKKKQLPPKALLNCAVIRTSG